MKCWFIRSLISALFLINCFSAFAQNAKKTRPGVGSEVLPGAWRMNGYVPQLKNRRVALIINQTSVIGTQSLLDTLLKRNISIVKVFVPEHGFRGTADAGAHVKSDIDEKTKLPIISLYGDNKKPKQEQLADVDVVIYDLQDVGVRFYTYISTLEYAMEACAENGVELMVLDRPNPNGHYVAGPVLDKSLQSFVGMQSVPIVYGMTPGEYAKMLMGERLFTKAANLKLNVIPCANYDHKTRYTLPVAPSPNLKNMAAIYLYPSLCLFEGTVVSVGRGTDMPFQQWGHPDFKQHSDYFFVPRAVTGASKPVLEGKECFGKLVASEPDRAYSVIDGKFQLEWLIQAYNWYPEKDKFFNTFFEKLAGTTQLRKQIESGESADAIVASWVSDISDFKKVRRKYLLYKDFE